MERENGMPPVHPGEILNEDILPSDRLSKLADNRRYHYIVDNWKEVASPCSTSLD